METGKWYDHEDLRICKFWLQKERCSNCLFDAICSPEDKKQDQNKWNTKKKSDWDLNEES